MQVHQQYSIGILSLEIIGTAGKQSILSMIEIGHLSNFDKYFVKINGYGRNGPTNLPNEYINTSHGILFYITTAFDFCGSWLPRGISRFTLRLKNLISKTKYEITVIINN